MPSVLPLSLGVEAVAALLGALAARVSITWGGTRASAWQGAGKGLVLDLVLAVLVLVALVLEAMVLEALVGHSVAKGDSISLCALLVGSKR